MGERRRGRYVVREAGWGRGKGEGRRVSGESVLSIRLADVIREIQGPSISDERGERGQLNIGLN
jgi:hypothetical protein